MSVGGEEPDKNQGSTASGPGEEDESALTGGSPGAAAEASPVSAGDDSAASTSTAVQEDGTTRGRVRRGKRLRRFFAAFLVVLFSLCLFMSSLSIWAVRQVLNTNVFVSHVTTAIQNPDVQNQISTYVTNEVVTAVNPTERFDKVLPKKAQVIVAPVVSAFHTVLYNAVHKLVVSPKFQKILITAITKAHMTAVNLLEGKPAGNLKINGNEVVLNTLPMIDKTIDTLEQHGVLTRLLNKVPPLATANGMPSAQVQQLSQKLGVALPPTFGQVVVFKSDQLHAAQVALKKLHRALVLIVVLTVVLAALALIVSPRRLRTVVMLGIGAVIVGVLTWGATAWATNEVVNLAKTGQARGSMRAILEATTSGLVTFMWVVIIVGALAAILAFVFGESKTARRIRAWFARIADRLPGAFGHTLDFIGAHADGFRVAGYAVGVGIILLWLSLAGLIAAVVVEVLWQVGLMLIRRRSEPPESSGPSPVAPVSTAS